MRRYAYGPYRWNPGKIETARWPDIATARNRMFSMLSNTDIYVETEEGRPFLVLDPPFKFSFGRKKDDPKGRWKKGDPKYQSSVCIFSTSNSKMKCPTFSLGAGEPEIGGTCPAQSMQYTMKDPENFVCTYCYAGKGNMAMESVQLGYAVRLLWVNAMLDPNQGGSPEHFADSMTAIIEKFYAHLPARLSQMGGRFMRIHDSGDFFDEEYFLGWIMTAANFKDVGLRFWAPTRMWGRKSFQQIAQKYAPENFMIRGSAYRANDPAPDAILGNAPGSTVNHPIGSGHGIHGKHVDIAGKQTWICPAYRGDNPAASCVSERCRTCWYPKDYVSYTIH